MLAHNGLALITEKLQNQRLEEPPPSTASCCSSSSATKLPQITYENTSTKTTCQQQSNLAVKGKNVWALSVESERSGRHEITACPEAKPPTLRPQSDKIQIQPPSLAAVCKHKKFRHSCHFCDSAPGTPTAPPKKKHCRSLSVPPDGPTVSQGKGPPKLWRPIAVIPLSGSSNASAQETHISIHNTAVESLSNKLSVIPTNETSSTSSWLPKLTSGFKLVPTAVPSPPSVDSGHFTTSDLQTPPGSPVPPRPASAASDTSLSSFGSAWQHGVGSPLRSRGARVLENRSLSCEDRISGCSSTAVSMPCVHDVQDSSSSSSRCRSSSQDGSSGCGGAGAIPRCHSQPCVLHHRRCGKKRRRNCDRPTLNFNKMTETAYPRSHRRSEPWNTPVQDHRLGLQQDHNDFLDSGNASRISFCLNPIASSPLDSDLPVSGYLAEVTDLSHAASIALPLTPPDQASPPSFSQQQFLNGRGRFSGREEEETEEEDEEINHTNCSCHDSRADEGVGLFPLNDLDLEQIENH